LENDQFNTNSLRNKYLNDPEEMEYWAAHPILTEAERKRREANDINDFPERINLPF
jgi:hypothetical protein